MNSCLNKLIHNAFPGVVDTVGQTDRSVDKCCVFSNPASYYYLWIIMRVNYMQQTFRDQSRKVIKVSRTNYHISCSHLESVPSRMLESASSSKRLVCNPWTQVKPHEQFMNPWSSGYTCTATQMEYAPRTTCFKTKAKKNSKSPKTQIINLSQNMNLIWYKMKWICSKNMP